MLSQGLDLPASGLSLRTQALIAVRVRIILSLVEALSYMGHVLISQQSQGDTEDVTPVNVSVANVLL